jgi:ferritin-like metal-binding protein YciE
MAAHNHRNSPAKLVRSCIRRREGKTSVIKDTGGKLIATGQALSGMFVGDEIMKGSPASYTFEAMEIASYRILISAANYVDDKETARICKKILAEEEAMAAWLEKTFLPSPSNTWPGRKHPALPQSIDSCSQRMCSSSGMAAIVN